jgi:hypothetical protein
MREGATRIKDIEYVEGKKADHTFLVLPQEPDEQWTAEATWERHQVSVIWRTDSGWAGRNLEIALGREFGGNADARPDSE